MSDDLVKRLRVHVMRTDYLSSAAADRIEELEAENKRLRLEAAHANDTADVAIERAKELEANINIKADFIDATINQLAASDQRIEELEAKLEKAIGWFDEIRQHCDNFGRGVPAIDERIVDRCEDTAANALAELKGQDDE